MTKLTPQELDERIEEIHDYFGWNIYPENKKMFKQLIRDCIEAVTPEKRYSDKDIFGERPDMVTVLDMPFNEAIDTIQANTKELLG